MSGGRHLSTDSSFLPTQHNTMCIYIVLLSGRQTTLYQSLAVTVLEMFNAAFLYC